MTLSLQKLFCRPSFCQFTMGVEHLCWLGPHLKIIKLLFQEFLQWFSWEWFTVLINFSNSRGCKVRCILITRFWALIMVGKHYKSLLLKSMFFDMQTSNHCNSSIVSNFLMLKCLSNFLVCIYSNQYQSHILSQSQVCLH